MMRGVRAKLPGSGETSGDVRFEKVERSGAAYVITFYGDFPDGKRIGINYDLSATEARSLLDQLRAALP
jgi:hypothetical protein